MADTAEETAAAEAAAAKEEAAAAAAAEPDYKADAEKWKAMSRKHEGQAKANADAAKRLAEIEESNKSEQQRSADAGAAAEARAVAAESRALRLEIAAEKSVPAKLLKFLAGGTREEIEASADELIEAITPDTGKKEVDAGETSGGRPKERLRPGADNTVDLEEADPREIAAKIPRSRF